MVPIVSTIDTRILSCCKRQVRSSNVDMEWDQIVAASVTDIKATWPDYRPTPMQPRPRMAAKRTVLRTARPIG